MKLLRSWLPVMLAMLFASCIREEPLNAECDILAVEIPGNVLNREPVIENTKITLVVKNNTNITALAPEFEITPGAIISPQSGTTLNFTTPQKYTVTSEDGKWHKEYTVTVVLNNTIELHYAFDHVRQYSNDRYSYDIFYEVGANGDDALTWATANPGFALTGEGTKDPASFPTYAVPDGMNGPCVQLQTRLTGGWGTLVGKPLAAGNLFFGYFDTSNALSKPLESTQFGIPFNRVPKSMTGYYKYKPGDTYYKKNSSGRLEEVPGKTDEFNIYGVFFESVPGMERLNGTNILAKDNPNILATAEFEPGTRNAASEWTEFNLPFIFREGKKVDPEKLQEGRYSITIVFVSSADGEIFSGAPGSTLTVDEVSLTCIEDAE